MTKLNKLRYRNFKIKILEKDEIQIEYAEMDNGCMLIGTDLAHPITENTYQQVGYGIADEFSQADIEAISKNLRSQLLELRQERLK